VQSSKYFSGRYAVCADCGEKPCSCATAAISPANIVPLRAAPASGNAIPFVVWDTLIAAHQLSIVESGVLLYLCRRTIGYGQHGGDLISLSGIACGLRISRRATMRALERLSYYGLIVRTQRREEGSQEYARTHIRVTLEAP
jgi:hypothetical protein